MATRLTWLGHATVLMDFSGTRVLTDPVLRGRLAHLLRAGPAPPMPADLDAVLLSHLHHDHADVPTLKRIGRACGSSDRAARPPSCAVRAAPPT